MRAGKLRHKIVIQQITVTQDANGDATKTWATVKSSWANVIPVSGREYFSAKQHTSEISHIVELRYDPSIAPKMRVLHDSRYFDIEAAINDKERDRQTTLMCREVV